MIFELVNVVIDDMGDVVLGKNTGFSAYSFQEPLVEISDKGLKSFMLADELVKDKSKYSGSMFFCLKTNSIYVNIMNWYRFKNNIKLLAGDDFSAILSKVEIVPTKDKTPPADAFAKYNKTFQSGKTIWLTCPYALHQDSASSVKIMGVKGDKLKKFGYESSRIIYPSKTAPKVANKSGLARFFAEGSSATTLEKTSMFWVKDQNSAIMFYVTKTDTAMTPYLYEGGVWINGKSYTILEFNDQVSVGSSTVKPSNYAGISVQDQNAHGMNALISNSNGEKYLAGGPNNLCKSQYIKDWIEDPKIVEFANFDELHAHLVTKYGDSKWLSLCRLESSDYYSDKACTNLMGILSAIPTITKGLGSFAQFFDVKTAPDIIYQNKAVYLDVSHVNPEVYVVNVVSDYKAITPYTSAPRTVQGSLFANSTMVIPYPFEYFMFYGGPSIRGGLKYWLPNTHQGKMLKSFAEAFVYAGDYFSSGPLVRIYNGKAEYHDGSPAHNTTDVGFDKVTFAPKYKNKELYSNITAGSVNVDDFYKGEYLNGAYENTPWHLPTTDNPPTSLDEIEYYQPCVWTTVKT